MSLLEGVLGFLVEVLGGTGPWEWKTDPPKRGLEVNWPAVFVLLVIVLVALFLARVH